MIKQLAVTALFTLTSVVQASADSVIDRAYDRAVEYLLTLDQYAEYSTQDLYIPVDVYSKEDLCTTYFGREIDVDDCQVIAIYDRNQESIVVAESYVDKGPEFLQYVLVHELVHHIQKISGKYDDYQCIAQSEEEAYNVSNQYIDDKELPQDFKPGRMFLALVSKCSMDW